MGKRKTWTPDAFYVDLQFPSRGINDQNSFGRQPPQTTADARNVLAYEPGTDRQRGGQRPGLSKYFSGTVNGDYHIQDINHLITTHGGAPSDDAGSLISPFTYGLAVAGGNSDGVGVASGEDGSSVATFTDTQTLDGFTFECSCWDDDGNAYVAMHNRADGIIKIYKLSSAGAVVWESPDGRYVFPFASSYKAICGMVVINLLDAVGVLSKCLCFAANVQEGGTLFAGIFRLQCADGGIFPGNADGTFLTSLSAGNGGMTFSTNSHNCLGKIGTLLGIDCRGGANFTIVETNPLSASFGTIIRLSYGGSATNNNSKVISDGVANFYVIASDSGVKIRKITKAGLFARDESTGTAWSAATVIGADTPTSIALDASTGYLVATFTTTKSMRRISVASGAEVAISGGTGIDPGSITRWDEVDCDGKGFFTVWRSSQASNNVMGLNTTLGTAYSPVSLANALHDGASVNRATARQSVDVSISSRQVRLLIVANGEVRLADPNGTYAVENSATSSDNVFAPLNPVVFSAQAGQNMFYLDGASYTYYKSSNNTMTTWTASTAGALPVDSLNNPCRLIAFWRGRLVIAALINDPHNWFMSATGDPFDWDFSPASRSSTQAFSGTTSGLGVIGDSINCVIPYSDDLVLFGTDHTIVQMTGDPGEGGALDIVSPTIGIAWGNPWCTDESGRIYFFSNQTGVYRMVLGAQPVMISSAIKRRLESVYLQRSLIRMVWDLVQQGLWLFITPLDPDEDAINYFWERRTNGWFEVVFDDPSFNPLAVHAFDGDNPNDRTIMFGGRNGYVRVLDYSKDTDDGKPINWHFTIGPVTNKYLDELLMLDMQATLGTHSNDVRYDVYCGDCAEEAFEASQAGDSEVYGTFGPGRNPPELIGRAGHAIYVKLSGSKSAAMEVIRANFLPRGLVRRRH